MKCVALVDYSCVHVNNHQGGGGEVFKKEAIISLYEGFPVEELYDYCFGSIESTGSSEHYGIEDLKILSIKICNVL